jgi:cholesterol oxidase
MPVERAGTVVVGSGFGGSVCAYRLAKDGEPVVVLERGKPYPPGSFPRTPGDLRTNFWDPDERRFGLFDFRTFGGFDALVSSGLGGGSLIYANVLLRKDERWFVHEDGEPWPVSRAELDRHYQAVEDMLTPSPYPLAHPEFADTPKTHAMRSAAEALGLDWSLPPLAVSFAAGAQPGISLPIAEPEYGNLHGRQRRTCRLCGECDFGCNEGAKNTLDHTYLSAARHHGADLRTLCEVQVLRPRESGGYEVGYVQHDPDRPSVARMIICERVVLAAGTFGTTYLLLRNRNRLPRLSKALGTRFSGNGDMISFLLRARDGERVRTLAASRGPVITSMVRVPDTVDGGDGRGFYIQDAGYPAFVDWLVENVHTPEFLLQAGDLAVRHLMSTVTGRPLHRVSREIAQLLSEGELSAGSMPLLGMGRDVPDGVMRLRSGRLDVEWSTKTSRAYYDRVRETMRRISQQLGGDYLDSPLWMNKRIVTAHPLGGAPIGRDSREGVCDPFGEVYGHPGLYVADGAAMPGPVGANPSLTIAALADRLSDRLLAAAHRSGEPVRGHVAVPVGALRGPAGTATLAFTERMTGPFAITAPGRLTFELTITIDDLDQFLADPRHEARAEGWVECAELGGRLRVEHGTVNLIMPGPAKGHRQMRYHLPLPDSTVLTGQKDLHDDVGLDLWLDTSTLAVRLLSAEQEPLGAGELHIRKHDFLRQLTTFEVDSPDTLRRFGTFFLGKLWEQYGPKPVVAITEAML